MKNSRVCRGLLASLGHLLCALGAAAQGTQPPLGGADGGATPRPCGDIFVPCWSGDAGSGGGGEGSPCICGTGAWIRETVRSVCTPVSPVVNSEDEWVDLTHFRTNRNLSATQTSAHAQVDSCGWSTFWSEGSRAFSESASFSHLWREVWRGTGPRCPRKVMLMAGGEVTAGVTATCSATQGCSAAASATACGSCASHGDAWARVNPGEVKCSAGYESAAAAWRLSGSIGPDLAVTTPSMTGTISSEHTWSAKGVGSCSGTLSLEVRPDRSFCAFTNRTVRASMSGEAAVSGGASVSENGSASWVADVSVSLWIA